MNNATGGGEGPTSPSLELPDGIPLVGLSMLDEHRFLTGLKVQQLPNLFLNPHIAENPALVDALPAVRKFAERRAVVQRLMRAQQRKRRNVASYRDYMLEVVKGQRMGSMPPIEAWTPELVVVQGGAAFIPWGEQLIAFDSDTQLAAWFELIASGDEDVLDYKVPVVLHSGRSTEWAQQQLHDRNAYGVKMTASEALERDSYDQVTSITKDLMAHSGLRVATQKRQLGARDEEQITLSALRQGVLTTVAGKAGIQIGAKPFQVVGEVDARQLSAEVCAAWDAILRAVGKYLTPDGRRQTVLPAPSIMAGLGVLANRVMGAEVRRPETKPLSLDELELLLSDVCWDRTVGGGADDVHYPWDGIAGKANRQLRKFSVGGAKEYAYSVAEALEDPLSSRGQQIRLTGNDPRGIRK